MSNNQEFFQKIGEAFAKGDVDFLIENVTEDIKWNFVGQAIIVGKDAVTKMLEPMKGVEAKEYITNKLITHGKTAVIEGTMKMPEESGELKHFAFCDLYTLDKDENGKIKEMTAYLIELDR